MRNKLVFGILGALILCSACEEQYLPKPKGLLRLEYPETKYAALETDQFSMSRSVLSNIVAGDGHSLTLDYPALRASIFITYKKIEGNLDKLLSDAQKLSYEHVVKADNIMEQPFVNDMERVYGMYYEVKGDAASQSQFYATDSVGHFITGSLYFHVKPNYDSILPAAEYLQQDIRKMLESLHWKP